jgi:hypothetical protein
MHRQAPVALELGAGELGDHFLRGRLDHELTLVAVAKAQKFRPIGLPAPRLLPQLPGLHHRHGELEGAGAVHFLADDPRHLLDHAHAERQPGVDAGGHAPDDPRAQHEAVAHELGFSRAFLLRREKELRGFHFEVFIAPAPALSAVHRRFLPALSLTVGCGKIVRGF